MDARWKHRNPTVGCGIEQSTYACNPTEYVGIHSVRIFRFVLKTKIDEIHSKPRCLLEIKTYQKDISVQFGLECISSNFLLKQDETHPGGVLQCVTEHHLCGAPQDPIIINIHTSQPTTMWRTTCTDVIWACGHIQLFATQDPIIISINISQPTTKCLVYNH